MSTLLKYVKNTIFFYSIGHFPVRYQLKTSLQTFSGWLVRGRKLAPLIRMSYVNILSTLLNRNLTENNKKKVSIMSIVSIPNFFDTCHHYLLQPALWVIQVVNYFKFQLSAIEWTPLVQLSFLPPSQDGTNGQTFWNDQWIREVRFKVFRTIGY